MGVDWGDMAFIAMVVDGVRSYASYFGNTFSDNDGHVQSLVASLPVMTLCAVYPVRGRYIRLSLMTYGVVYIAQTVELVRTINLRVRPGDGHAKSIGLVMSCLCLDSAVLTGMLLILRLWGVFGGMTIKRSR